MVERDEELGDAVGFSHDWRRSSYLSAVVLAVEVLVHHAVDADKARDFEESGIRWIEVQLTFDEPGPVEAIPAFGTPLAGDLILSRWSVGRCPGAVCGFCRDEVVAAIQLSSWLSGRTEVPALTLEADCPGCGGPSFCELNPPVQCDADEKQVVVQLPAGPLTIDVLGPGLVASDDADLRVTPAQVERARASGHLSGPVSGVVVLPPGKVCRDCRTVHSYPEYALIEAYGPGARLVAQIEVWRRWSHIDGESWFDQLEANDATANDFTNQRVTLALSDLGTVNDLPAYRELRDALPVSFPIERVEVLRRWTTADEPPAWTSPRLSWSPYRGQWVEEKMYSVLPEGDLEGIFLGLRAAVTGEAAPAGRLGSIGFAVGAYLSSLGSVEVKDGYVALGTRPIETDGC